MIVRIVLFLFSTLIPCQVLGRVIDVRAGEHGHFSRIVLNIPRETTWELVRSGNIALLDIDLPDVEFNTERVFDRIPNSRLRKVAQSHPGAELQLSIGCECIVNAFVQSDTLLVIDILDNMSIEELDLVEILEKIDYRYGNISKSAFVDPRISLKFSSEQSFGAVNPQEFDQIGNLSHLGSQTIEMKVSANNSEIMLLNGIGKAVSKGYLRLAEDVTHQANEPKLFSFLYENEEAAEVKPLNPLGQMTVANPSNVVRESFERGIDKELCLAEHMVALSEWGDESEFSAQIGKRRSDLYDANGELVQLEIFQLARAFLYFGFGAEASRVLNLIPNNSLQKKALLGIANIFEWLPVQEKRAFTGMEVCDSDVALWAFLANLSSTKKSFVNTNAVLTAFSRLPIHLREYFGQQLAEKFDGIGDSISRELVLRAVNRGLGRQSFETLPTLLRSDSSLNGIAGNELARIAWSGTERSPQAMVDLVDMMISTNSSFPAPEDLADVIASYLVEYRRTEIGPSLYRAHFLSLALGGRFLEAFEAQSTFFERFPKTSEEMSEGILLRFVAAKAADMEFLQFSFTQLQDERKKIPFDLENTIALRLLFLGFPDRAERLLQKNPTDLSEKKDRAIIRARIHVAQDLPHRALADLFGMNGVEEDEIRAEALFMAGDYINAGMSFESGKVDSARAFWHAEDWGFVLRDAESPYFGAALAAKELSQIAPKSELAVSLEDVSALVESAKVARLNILELLDSIAQVSESIQ